MWLNSFDSAIVCGKTQLTLLLCVTKVGGLSYCVWLNSGD